MDVNVECNGKLITNTMVLFWKNKDAKNKQYQLVYKTLRWV